MAHIGVKNRTAEPQVLTYDGQTRWFKPNEVRIIEGIPEGHAETRIDVFHPKSKDAQGREIQEQRVVGRRLFDVLSIDDALKAGARPEESPAAQAARSMAEAKRKARQELLSELKASLLEDGWTPPAATPAAGKPETQEGDSHVEL